MSLHAENSPCSTCPFRGGPHCWASQPTASSTMSRGYGCGGGPCGGGMRQKHRKFVLFFLSSTLFELLICNFSKKKKNSKAVSCICLLDSLIETIQVASEDVSSC
eukprot:TRINITY_DN4374_c0_g3_i1.p2 TRINITY_DN4374_c0_g3~~TRINITY_DN4374_c0_g3_i1.p2  ORF type:complete len:105 (+),score=21.48 TRINITY_DN4374_c0_g3_i1:176-490(+)